METPPDISQDLAQPFTGDPPREVGPIERRREALAPHFADVERVAEQVDPAEPARPGQLADKPLELGAWERRMLRRDGPAGDRSRGLLCESLAFQLKCDELNGLFEHGPLPPPGELRSFLDGLVTCVAVGRALMEELQRDLNWLIGHGKLADAKNLSSLRTKVAQGTWSLEQRLGEHDVNRVQQRVAQLIDEAAEIEPQLEVAVEHRPSAAPGPLLEEQEPDDAGWASYGNSRRPRQGELPPWLTGETEAPFKGGRRRTGRSEAERRKRVKHLLMLLAVMVALYAVVMYPRLSRPPGPPLLTLGQFSHLESVRGVTARPPSLFVVLDAAGWRSSSTTARHELLAEIGDIVERSGYSGFHARTSDGVTVGQWMKSGGVQLTARPSDPS